MSLLKNDKHAAWVVLSTSLAQTLDYSITFQYPSDVLEAAAGLDARLWRGLEQLAGHPRIPRGDEGLGFEALVAQGTGVAALEGRSYQHLMAAQPIKLGGCGLRSTAESRLAAFIGGVEMALPYLVEGDHRQEVLCPLLEEVIGRVSGQQRWENFLAAGSRTAQEFSQAWDELTREASEIFTFLHEEPSGPLAVPVAEAGGRSLDAHGPRWFSRGRCCGINSWPKPSLLTRTGVLALSLPSRILQMTSALVAGCLPHQGLILA